MHISLHLLFLLALLTLAQSISSTSNDCVSCRCKVEWNQCQEDVTWFPFSFHYLLAKDSLTHVLAITTRKRQSANQIPKSLKMYEIQPNNPYDQFKRCVTGHQKSLNLWRCVLVECTTMMNSAGVLSSF